MFNNKKIKFIISLAIILYTSIAASDDSASKTTVHQMANWSEPLELVERQLTYFDNYWSNIFNNKYYNNYHSINNKLIVQDKKYLMILEIPGFDKEQIKVKLIGNRLFINGNINEENSKKTAEDYKFVKENNFNFSFTLNEDIDKENITSNLKNGVLTIDLPRITIEDQKAKEIPIS